MTLQLTVGFSSCAPVVVCENVVATPYVQSQAVIVPGADDVLPNVQLMMVPLFPSGFLFQTAVTRSSRSPLWASSLKELPKLTLHRRHR